MPGFNVVAVKENNSLVLQLESLHDKDTDNAEYFSCSKYVSITGVISNNKIPTFMSEIYIITLETYIILKHKVKNRWPVYLNISKQGAVGVNQIFQIGWLKLSIDPCSKWHFIGLGVLKLNIPTSVYTPAGIKTLMKVFSYKIW